MLPRPRDQAVGLAGSSVSTFNRAPGRTPEKDRAVWLRSPGQILFGWVVVGKAIRVECGISASAATEE